MGEKELVVTRLANMPVNEHHTCQLAILLSTDQLITQEAGSCRRVQALDHKRANEMHD